MTNTKPFRHKSEPAGLYVHIPFCLKKCPYCDFYSITDSSLQHDFTSALISEIRMIKYPEFLFDTIYIGGGTPSLLDARTISQILDASKTVLNTSDLTEITIEINPGTIVNKKLIGYREAGINRINIGVQSFQEKNLKFLGRIHTVGDTEQSIQWARDAGFKNIGLDIIYGIPGQTRDLLLNDLKKAIEYRPEHLSCYMLTYEHGTPLEKDLKNGAFNPLTEKQVGDLFLLTLEFLSKNGYHQYEVSNFALSKRSRSRHNRKYWSFGPYIGVGPSAHSYIYPERSWNKADVSGYIEKFNSGQRPDRKKEILTTEQMMIEMIYLGFRKVRGINTDKFNDMFQLDFNQIFKNELDQYRKKGLVRTTDKYCSLTQDGFLFLDSIASAFISKDLIKNKKNTMNSREAIC